MAYIPGSVPFDAPEGLKAFLADELRRIAGELGGFVVLTERHEAPSRNVNGALALADGTDWNPGAGQGVYCYYNGSWNKLG